MIEKKIRFTVVRIIYVDNDKDICRASIRIKDKYQTKTMDIKYKYMELETDNEYEAVIIEEIETNVIRVKEITTINNITTFIKEGLYNDRNIRNQIKQNIINDIGEKGIESLIDYSKELMELDMLNKDKAKYITDKAEKHADLVVIKEYCKSNKIKVSIANIICENLGGKALDVISNNPYSLIDYDISLKIIDTIANKAGLSYESINRVKCGVTEYSKYCSKKNGHVFILANELIEHLNEYMNKYGGFSGADNITNEIIKEAIDKLKGEGIIKVYTNEKGEECIYLKELFEYEQGIAEILSEKLLKKVEISKSVKEKVENFINNYSDGDKKLTSEQAQALRNAVTENVSLVRGYPGTGKTQTLRAIVSCINYIDKELNIEVIGFTGKLVSKVNEILPDGTTARTVHRFLGLTKEKAFIPNKKDVDFIILEESTMIDIKLFYYILQSIRQDTQILMLGDECQLSSIGAGGIFENLIQSNLIKTVKLTTIFRQKQGSTIIDNIHKMADGIGFADKKGLKCKKGEFELVTLEKEAEITEKIKKTVNKLIKDGHKLDNIQILSVCKENEGGTKAINRAIQEEFIPNPRSEFYDLAVGDKVMQNINNYDLKTFNGEMGIIVKNEYYDNERRIVVRYRDKTVEYKGNSIRQLTQAWGISIHKSQGSEFSIVIFPLLKKDKDILNKNLLYTACSRAKKQLIIIAAADTFDKAIKKVQDVRNSNLIEMLMDRLKEIAGRTA
jgi:exodeoxyribonuclease V alpha subunit